MGQGFIEKVSLEGWERVNWATLRGKRVLGKGGSYGAWPNIRIYLVQSENTKEADVAGV